MLQVIHKLDIQQLHFAALLNKSCEYTFQIKWHKVYDRVFERF